MEWKPIKMFHKEYPNEQSRIKRIFAVKKERTCKDEAGDTFTTLDWVHIASPRTPGSREAWSLCLRGIEGAWGGMSFIRLQQPTHYCEIVIVDGGLT